MNLSTMKIICLVLLFTYSGILCADERYSLRVDGMTSSFRAYGIEKKLMEIEGVKHIDIDFEKGLVLVTTANGLNVTEQALQDLIENAGYTFREMQRTDGDNMQLTK